MVRSGQGVGAVEGSQTVVTFHELVDGSQLMIWDMIRYTDVYCEMMIENGWFIMVTMIDNRGLGIRIVSSCWKWLVIRENSGEWRLKLAGNGD